MSRPEDQHSHVASIVLIEQSLIQVCRFNDSHRESSYGLMIVIFPFINQMVEELGVTDNPDRVGFYSGLVVSFYLLTIQERASLPAGSSILFRTILHCLPLGKVIRVSSD